MDIKEIANKAIEIEQNGIEVYTQCVTTAKNPLVQKVFAYLAEQQIIHIERIKAFEAGTLKEGDLSGNAMEKAKNAVSGVMKEIGTETTEDITDKEAYEKGLKLEQESFNLYEKAYNESDTEQEKEFFKFLMGEEKAHYELLQKSHDFLQNPTHWVENEEGWFL